MFVYVRSEPNLWTVGHYSPDGKWYPESDHGSPDAAAERVHWLNGGGMNQKSAEKWPFGFRVVDDLEAQVR